MNRKYSSLRSAYHAERFIVQDNITISPAQMNEFNKSNIPISASMVSEDMLSPGHEGVDAEVPLLRKRGLDFSDIYVAERSARSKVSSAISSAEVIKSSE